MQPKLDDWQVDVKFQENGAMMARASGVLLAQPEDAVAFVTHEAGDKLFRVVQRRELPPSAAAAAAAAGSRRVEVVNKAAIRLLAWKLYSKSTVTYEISSTPPSAAAAAAAAASQQQGISSGGSSKQEQQQGLEQRVSFELVSSSMLQSLSGTWSLRPLRLHISSLPQHIQDRLAGSSPTGAAFGAPSAAAAAAAAEGKAGACVDSKAPLLQCSTPCLTIFPLSLSVDECDNHKSAAAAAATATAAAALDCTISSLHPRGLTVKTSPKLDSSSSNSSGGSNSGTPMSPKSSFLHKLSLLSPRRSGQSPAATPTAAGAAAPGELTPCARRVVAITARTSSTGPFPVFANLLGGSSFLGVHPFSKDGKTRSNSSSCAGGAHGKGRSSSSSGCGHAAGGLVVDADGFVTATQVLYEQLAQPKGMPAGIRYVPGLSDAVAGSVGREVRQMLEKVSCVSDMAVSQGLGPQAALRFVVREMEAAGGSWKALKKALRRRQHHHQQQQQQRGQTQLLLSDSPGVPFALQAVGHTEPLMTATTTLATEAEFGLTTTLHPVLLSLDGCEAAAAAVVGQKVGGQTGRTAVVRELMSHPVMLPECSSHRVSFTDC